MHHHFIMDHMTWGRNSKKLTHLLQPIGVGFEHTPVGNPSCWECTVDACTFHPAGQCINKHTCANIRFFVQTFFIGIKELIDIYTVRTTLQCNQWSLRNLGCYASDKAVNVEDDCPLPFSSHYSNQSFWFRMHPITEVNAPQECHTAQFVASYSIPSVVTRLRLSHSCMTLTHLPYRAVIAILPGWISIMCSKFSFMGLGVISSQQTSTFSFYKEWGTVPE